MYVMSKHIIVSDEFHEKLTKAIASHYAKTKTKLTYERAIRLGYGV